MDRIIAPLTDYDIFAYLMVGIAALAASDLVLRSRFLIRDNWDFGVATMAIIAAYVAGQIAAAPAEWILERRIARNPVDHLVMSAADYQKLLQSGEDFNKACEARREEFKGLLPGTVFSYRQPLSCFDQQNIRKKEPALDGDALFFKAYRSVRYQEHVRDRLSTFSRLYIFCRNMSFVAFLAAFIVAVQAAIRWTVNRPEPKTAKKGKAAAKQRSTISPWLFDPRWQFILFTAIGFGLLYRYLFFYRLYSIEVLTAYASG